MMSGTQGSAKQSPQSSKFSRYFDGRGERGHSLHVSRLFPVVVGYCVEWMQCSETNCRNSYLKGALLSSKAQAFEEMPSSSPDALGFHDQTAIPPESGDRGGPWVEVWGRGGGSGNRPPSRRGILASGSGNPNLAFLVSTLRHRVPLKTAAAIFRTWPPYPSQFPRHQSRATASVNFPRG